MLPSLKRLSLGAPPVTTLEQDSFDLIAEKLVERVNERIDDDENYAFADELCDLVTQVCHEVSTLERMSGNDAGKYDCSNPDSLVWKAAHSIFGVDALADFGHENPERRMAPLTKLRGDTWRDSFRTLCKVFAYGAEQDLQYELLRGQAGWVRLHVWVDLYSASSLEREAKASKLSNSSSYKERARAAYILKNSGMRKGDPGFKSYSVFRRGEGMKEWMQEIPEDVWEFKDDVRFGGVGDEELIFAIRKVEQIISSLESDYNKDKAGRMIFIDTGPNTIKAQIVAFQKEMCQLGNLLYAQKRQDPEQTSSAAANPFPKLWKRAHEWEDEDDDDDDEPATPDRIRNERMDELDDEW
jgi:hypothetical protein